MTPAPTSITEEFVRELQASPDARVRAYTEVWLEERKSDYPEIDLFEKHMGYAVPRENLDLCARELACPLKKHPPNWQHGRVIYATLRRYLQAHPDREIACYDIGTAKGFSAIMMAWALSHAERKGLVVSVDVVWPSQRTERNSVAELDGLKMTDEFMEPWVSLRHVGIVLLGGGSPWCFDDPSLEQLDRIDFAFIDGKHSYDAVLMDASRIAERQQRGDVIIFDDLQIPGVARAVESLDAYDLTFVAARPDRRYAIAKRL